MRAFDRLLPSNLEAERIILANMMLGADPLAIADTLEASDFSLEANRQLFRACVGLARQGESCDRVMLANELERNNQLQSIGGLSYLASLDRGMPELPCLDSYIGAVRDHAIRRRALLALETLVEPIYAGGPDAREAIERAERIYADLLTVDAAEQVVFGDLEIQASLQSICYPERATHCAVQTPWPQFNDILEGGGFQPGQMVTIGARPSLGKTSLAIQVTAHAATQGLAVMFCTLEMSTPQLVRRMLYTRARIDSMRHSRGLSTASEVARLMTISTDSAWGNIGFVSSCRTLPAIRSAARHFRVKRPLSMLVIDYLQLITITGSARKRYEEVSEISRNIKLLAEELSVPVMVLAQLNREMEKDNRGPRSSDLRDSGSIEQDSDVIVMPHRLPNQDDGASSWDVDLIVTKQRNGITGKVPMRFVRQFTSYCPRFDGPELAP